MLLYTAIITYIVSVVVALLFFFAAKNLNPGWFRILASIHLVAAVLFVFNLINNKIENPHYFSFLAFICTGVICFGLAFGTRAALPFKIYFSPFALTLALFLLSPSTLFNFLLTANFNSSGEKPVTVSGNIYLERESSVFGNNTDVLYKLTEKHGMFHKTLSRDVNFNGKLDSIKILSLDINHEAVIRGYTSKKTFVSDENDSLDVIINLNPKKKDVIERKL